jgi:hypothetical protein
VIMRALAKEPDHRFASMADFRAALRPGDKPSAAPVGPPVPAQTTRGTSSPAAPDLASAAIPIVPTRVIEQKTAALEAAPTGPPSPASGVEPLRTTFSSTTGRVLLANTERRRRRLSPARWAALAAGVLVASALVVYATVLRKGSQAPEPPSLVHEAPTATPAATPAPPIPPVVPTAGPPDAAPLPAAASLPEHPFVNPMEKRGDKKGGRKIPLAPSVARAKVPASPTPPVTAPAIKPGQKW